MPGINWKEIAAKLPTAKGPEGFEQRKKLFKLFDPNGNKFLSLAEVDKGIRDILKLDGLFDWKPAIIRAFTAAKNIHKSKKQHGDDFIEWSEFRLLLCYLRQYFELYEMFDRIDTSDDRRVTLAEFKEALKMIQSWGLKIADAEAEFKKIDKNGGGVILFDEFCEWALKHKLDLEDDDDFADEKI
eukprot:GDKI01002757.1.p2 GENE.GDKI01002757.1~~GDKI01002757.1.p2  ORF type:complete len:185 (-),score=79.46 GDKI01002757.1:273-827(-)